MLKKNLTKTLSLTILITLLLAGNFTSSSSAQMYEDDGVFIDTLTNYTHISYAENCQLTNSSIQIMQTPGNFTYDFSNSNLSEAWYRNNAPEVFMPIIGPHILLEQQIKTSALENISYIGDDKKLKNFSTSSWLVPLHHFRIKINVSRQAVDEIHFLWNGSFNSEDGIRVFAWRYISSSTGWWTLLTATNETPVEDVIHTDPQKYVSGDGYIDFIVIPYRSYTYERTCLATDYVSVKISTTGKNMVARFDTKPITPKNLWLWEAVTWNATTPKGTRIRCQILNETGEPIKEEILKGNEKSFTTKPIWLFSLLKQGYTNISLRFQLETNNPDVSPILYDYKILWQPTINKWQVNFPDINGLRTETKTKDYLISIPIHLPQGYWWNRFYATTNLSQGGNISFSILDLHKKTIISNITSGDSIASVCTKTIRLRADFIRENDTENPVLKQWYITFKSDTKKPEYRDFSPTSVGQTTEDFNIQVRDLDSGLNTSSARYMLIYNVNGTMKNTTWLTASCSSENCTDCSRNWQTITAYDIPVFYSSKISQLIDTKGETNVTLYAIQFSIEDMAGNQKQSNVYEISIDVSPPNSEITGVTKELGGTITVEAEATEDTYQIELYYQYSPDNKTFSPPKMFDVDKNTPWEWSFLPNESGYYRFYTIAVDEFGNKETPPTDGDITVFIDNNLPDKPKFNKTIKWLSSPTICCVNFTDDFKLSKIEYTLNGEQNTWREIATNLNTRYHNTSFDLVEYDWDRIDEGEHAYIYFRVTDEAGNIYETPNNDEALHIAKDITPPRVQIDRITKWQWNNPFKITTYVNDDESGITNTTLLYRHSFDNKSWGNWTVYGSVTTNGTYIWSFSAPEEGYYQFMVVASNSAGKQDESEIVTTGVTLFPTTNVLVFIATFIALLITTIVVVHKWKTA